MRSFLSTVLAAAWRRPRLTLLLGLLVFVVGGVGARRLYSDLRPGIEDLLPQDAPSVRAMHQGYDRLPPMRELAVVLHVPGPAIGRRVASLVAAAVAQVPGAHDVEYGDLAERRFLDRYGVLLTDRATLEDVRDRLRARVRWEKRHHSAFFVSLDDEPAPAIDFAELRGHAGAELDRFPGGYYASGDGRTFVVVAHAGAGDAAADHALLAGVEARVGEVLARSAPGVTATYGGDVASYVEEHDALESDVAISGVLVLVLVGAGLWAFFLSLRCVAVLVFPVLVGTAAALGLGYLLLGHLNADTAFLGGIILGNGINAGIILLARLIEEHRTNADPHAATVAAVRATIGPTAIAAFAAAASYLALVSTRFAGFRQFGLLGGLGMALCWFSTVLVLPPAYALIGRPRPGARRPWHIAARFGRFVAQRPRAVATVFAALTVASGVLVWRHAGSVLEYDLLHLRSRASIHGAVATDREVDAIFGRYLTPTALLAGDAASAERLADALRAEAARPGSLIDRVVSASTLVPPDQPSKLELVQQIRKEAEKALPYLSEVDAAQLEAQLPPADLAPFAASDLPVSLRRLIVDREGKVAGDLVAIYPKLDADMWDGHVLLRFAGELRSAAAAAHLEGAYIGSAMVFSDLLTALRHDGPRATALALVAVLLIVLVLARRPRRAVPVWLSLLVGALLLAGGAVALGERLNFLNFIAIPLTFGIGVDYAVNLYGRYRDGRGSLGTRAAAAVAGAGGAIAMCSYTTMVGYSSLLFADSRALRSFGLVSDLGEIACLSTALLALPAVLAWVEKSRHSRAQPGRGTRTPAPLRSLAGSARAGGVAADTPVQGSRGLARVIDRS